jgi:2-polyprenyl-3-methyl-5-hydroxy-6-metoxy-1,4-benzoquinol methylase
MSSVVESPQLDAAKTEAFGAGMTALLNHSFLAMMISIGHRAGLFDRLAALPPSTSRQIADAAGLHERYVREWLGAMACGRIVDHDGRAGTYFLPREHAGFLTRAAGPNNLAMLTQFIALGGAIEDRVVSCFREGGGVSYSEQAKFTSLQAEFSAMFADAALVDAMLPLADGLVETLGRRARVLDVGCGSGHAVCLMARAFPKSRFEGVDFDDDGLAAARREAASLGLMNTTFRRGDAHEIGATAEYDVITAFEVVHDLRDPIAGLSAVHRALRPGGLLFMLEPAASSHLADNLAHPFGPFLYTASVFHCMTVSLAQGGAGCGTAWGEANTRRALAEAGFDAVDVKRLDGDVMNYYYVARKAA